ncbi:BT2 [Symbiodinium natans]|uniref:BT2 protein n=1 Tax=Symbiodinium natans TaxID=878477 RepID=A0A812SPP4_9DINO|nr:BT2 [Symbiodinium natans]
MSEDGSRRADMVWGFLSLWDLWDCETLQNKLPSNFDWTQPIGNDGLVPLTVLLLDPARMSNNKSGFLKLAEWMLKSGADPEQRLPAENTFFRSWFQKDKPDATRITVSFGGHSAITLAVAWLHAMQEAKGGANWGNETGCLREFLTLCASTVATRAARDPPTVPMRQSVVEVWESVRNMTATHNVIFETADGQVTAHDVVLLAASPVLKAMLESSMKEGSSKRISVEDSSSSGVSLFLDMLYTGSTWDDPDYKTMLVALDLAHRWQVTGVVDMVSDALPQMLAVDSFADIAEAAVLKGLDALQRACRGFGSKSEEIQAMLQAGSFPDHVQRLLGASATHACEPGASKGRRRSF